MQFFVNFCLVILALIAVVIADLDISPTREQLIGSINSDPGVNSVKTLLHGHPIYQSITTMADMRTFTESHVWAVWDFMTLLKRLQRDFTNTNEIWTPRKSADNARFIGEICLSEESDEFVTSSFKHISHFELYLLAMEDIGANTSAIRNFVARIESGDSFSAALVDAPISEGVKLFVERTIAIALRGDTVQATSAFFFGREDPIPEMFDRFLKNVITDDDDKLTHFRYYLARHIEVDGSDHGPRAIALLDSITNGDSEKIKSAIDAGTTAIQFRIEFWDDIYERIRGTTIVENF